MTPHPLNNKSHAYQLRSVRRDPTLIEHLESPRNDLQFEALCRNAQTYHMLATVDSSALLRAVKVNPILLNIVPADQLAVLSMAAVRADSDAIYHVQSPSLELQLAAIFHYPEAIQHIQNPCALVQRKVLVSKQGLKMYLEFPDRFNLAEIDSQYPGFKARFDAVIALGATGQEFSRLISQIDIPGSALHLPDLDCSKL